MEPYSVPKMSLPVQISGEGWTWLDLFVQDMQRMNEYLPGFQYRYVGLGNWLADQLRSNPTTTSGYGNDYYDDYDDDKA